MQPTIIFTAPVPGVICLNGRFAGEASRERPLFAPVSPFGALYLEYRPLAGEGSLARKLVFSGGEPLADDLEGAEGLYCVAWPGGVLEVEFAPPRPSAEYFTIGDTACALVRGEQTVLSMGGATMALPEGAGRPELHRLGAAAALLGDVEGGGRFLAALTGDLSVQTGLLTAAHIELSDDGLVNAVVDLGDSVGHGRLEQWLLDANGLNQISAQSLWSAGAPRWPRTAEGTMIAAVEAALAGQDAEVDGYLSPALARARPLGNVAEACDLCVPMKYAPPDPLPCVGLLKARGERLAVVRPLYYAAAPAATAQSPFQIESVSLE